MDGLVLSKQSPRLIGYDLNGPRLFHFAKFESDTDFDAFLDNHSERRSDQIRSENSNQRVFV